MTTDTSVKDGAMKVIPGFEPLEELREKVVYGHYFTHTKPLSTLSYMKLTTESLRSVLAAQPSECSTRKLIDNLRQYGKLFSRITTHGPLLSNVFRRVLAVIREELHEQQEKVERKETNLNEKTLENENESILSPSHDMIHPLFDVSWDTIQEDVLCGITEYIQEIVHTPDGLREQFVQSIREGDRLLVSGHSPVMEQMLTKSASQKTFSVTLPESCASSDLNPERLRKKGITTEVLGDSSLYSFHDQSDSSAHRGSSCVGQWGYDGERRKLPDGVMRTSFSKTSCCDRPRGVFCASLSTPFE